MKKVLLRAPVLSKSGYGEHSRQIFRYLLSKSNIDVKVQAVPWGMTPWSVNPESEGGLIGEAIKRSVGENDKNFDISFQVQLPNEWDPSIAKYNIGVTAGVETDISNPLWTSVHCEKMDKVIVPSQHTKSTLIKSSSTNTDIAVVPECYYDELTLDFDPLAINLETDFNFLTVGVLTGHTPQTDRKNLFYLIKWFIEEFKENKDVGLVVKTNSGRDTTIDKRNTKIILKRVLDELGYQGTPKVYLLHGAMNREEMTSLYKHPSIKAFVSCTRGEGFGLPFLESAVAGLPVIATGWSAHKEFMSKGKWIDVKYKLDKVHSSKIDRNIFVDGAKWAEVDEKDFKKRLKTFKEKPEMPKEWAEKLSEKLKKEYSFKAVCQKYDEALEGLLK